MSSSVFETNRMNSTHWIEDDKIVTLIETGRMNSTLPKPKEQRKVTDQTPNKIKKLILPVQFEIMKHLLSFIFLMFFVLMSCADNKPINHLDKIKFDMDLINDHGLEISSNSGQPIYYQFCIPKSDSLAMEVFKTEPAVDIYKDQAGEIGCTKEQQMCMGHTHPKGWKTRLIRLAKLPYVNSIERVSFGKK